MPRVGFTTENKVATTNYDYPKLKLALNERARILVGLEDPVMEYVHTLQKPQLVNGVPQTEEKINDRTKQKSTVNVMEFVSRPLCLGDATILGEKGSDPKNCPMCKLAKDHPDYTKPAQRRYAMHVIRYRTKGGSTDLVTPFSAETLVWSFTDTIFNKIIDMREEWGDLRKHDLLLGPCTNPMFQKFDISVAAKAAWLENPERKQLVAQTFKDNLIPDLTIACGSSKKLEWIEQDVADILEAWGAVSGAQDETSADLDTDLNGLMDTKAAPKDSIEKDDAGWAKSVDDESDPLAGLDLDADLPAAEEPEAKKPAARKPAAKKAAAPEPDAAPEPEASTPEPEAAADTSADVDNFDDLLADL